MAVAPHPLGGFRAYKKINGKEYQVYSFDFDEAQAEQKKLDAIAITLRKENPKLFNKNGRFNGFTIRTRTYKKNYRKPYIEAVQQLVKDKKRHTQCLTVKNVNDAIAWIVRNWADYYALETKQLMQLQLKINYARALYLADFKRAKIKIDGIK